MQHNNSPVLSSKFFSLLSAGLLLLFVYSGSSYSKEIRIAPGLNVLQKAINNASNGDTIILDSGTYTGSININRTLTIVGTNSKDRGDSIVDGENSSHTITISAPNVLIKNLHVYNSGTNLVSEDSGIFIKKEASNARIENNYLKNNQIGIYLKGPLSAIIRNNTIIGSQHHRMNSRGNGIYMWNTPGSVIENNDIRYGRDGIFVNVSKNNIFRNNKIRDLRFAIHYMYTHNSVIQNNISINNHVGYALMFSNNLLVDNNQSIGDRERGLFFNFANNSIITNNKVIGDTDKCLFIYNSHSNNISQNLFENCQIGIHFTAGSENNDIHLNSFINNKNQVKYVGTRHIEWSKNGKGNYWSDNTAFDIDNNGVADQPYKPNGLIDQIIWRHPMAKLLLNSPAVQIIKWAQSEFPGLHPGGVTDSFPLMLAPTLNSYNHSDLIDG